MPSVSTCSTKFEFQLRLACISGVSSIYFGVSKTIAIALIEYYPKKQRLVITVTPSDTASIVFISKRTFEISTDTDSL